MTNISRIPAIFTIEPPKGFSGVIRVSPLAGLLLGNQTKTLQVVFAPRETKEYRFRLPVKVRFGVECRGLYLRAAPDSFVPERQDVTLKSKCAGGWMWLRVAHERVPSVVVNRQHVVLASSAAGPQSHAGIYVSTCQETAQTQTRFAVVINVAIVRMRWRLEL